MGAFPDGVELAAGLGRSLGRGLATLVDPVIPLSFSRPGHRLRACSFPPGELEVDLSGRHVLVTGANSGIGYETALLLAARGARVSLLCRSLERGQRAAERIRSRTGSSRVRVVQLDVSRLRSVREAARRVAADGVDVLVHNAGVLPERRIETEDGLELTFATHVAGPFLLTQLLRGALETSTDGRVVWVSSGGMYTRRLRLDDVAWRTREYDGVLAYAETKRAQVVLAELFAERLRASRVMVHAMHPGWADTPSVRSSIPTFYTITRSVLRTPREGADTVAWLAASARARRTTGQFFLDRQARRTHLLPFTRESEHERARLWQLCEEAVGGRWTS